MFKKILLVIIVLLLTTPFILVGIGNVTPPNLTEQPLSNSEIENTSTFYDKETTGVHQVFLKGNAFQRGQQFGYWTRNLLLQQEKALFTKLDEVIPYKFLQYGLFLFSMGWFQGIEDFYETDWLHEMYGVSLHGSKENRFFATPFTRQLAYHGIHDMGQMMIDRGLVMGACTQVARPLKEGWLIGRNFDFEAGRVFDEDKVLKWVFPDKGQAFVSVIFSGMVGVISGINSSGVYVAINAAGSEDFTRIGTPTTLLALKALQYATSAEEAVAIIQQGKPLITDIFVVADGNQKLFIVEKTPERTRVLQKSTPTVVTNHLQHPDFVDDTANKKRIANNTTMARYQRASELLDKSLSTNDFLNLLRDKVSFQDKPVFGHRASIDALIASHAIIYNSQEQTLFVAQGPSLSQSFIGIDLKASFEKQEPVFLPSLPPDPELVDFDFYGLKNGIRNLHHIRKLATQGRCQQSKTEFTKLQRPEILQRHYAYYWTEASIALCFGHQIKAKDAFKKALARQPAYRHERNAIESHLQAL